MVPLFLRVVGIIRDIRGIKFGCLFSQYSNTPLLHHPNVNQNVIKNGYKKEEISWIEDN